MDGPKEGQEILAGILAVLKKIDQKLDQVISDRADPSTLTPRGTSRDDNTPRIERERLLESVAVIEDQAGVPEETRSPREAGISTVASRDGVDASSNDGIRGPSYSFCDEAGSEYDEQILEIVKPIKDMLLIPYDNRIPLRFSVKYFRELACDWDPTAHAWGWERFGKLIVKEITAMNESLDARFLRRKHYQNERFFQIMDCYEKRSIPEEGEIINADTCPGSRPLIDTDIWVFGFDRNSKLQYKKDSTVSWSSWEDREDNVVSQLSEKKLLTRIIVSQGFSSGINLEPVNKPRQYTQHPCFTTSFNPDYYRDHLAQRIERRHENDKSSILQLVYYRRDESGIEEYWPHGTLYNGSHVRKEAFNLQALFSKDFDKVTFNIFCAPRFYRNIEDSCPKTHLYISELDESAPVTLFWVVLMASQKIERFWSELDSKIQEILVQDEHSFLNPKEYVDLLYDDSTFSRSRIYFWAAGILPEFVKCISQNIEELDHFKMSNRRYKGYLYIPSPAEWPFMPEWDLVLERLKATRSSFKSKLDMVHGLRDALFNGSAVMETRQSRMLGENVQLLTFVSIFFLPISFVMTFWAVPAVSEKYPTFTIPIYSAIVIGGVSYILIFNLKRLIYFGRLVFSIPAEYILNKMIDRVDDTVNLRQWLKLRKWYPRIKQFEKYPKLEAPQISNWWLVIFLLKISKWILDEKLRNIFKRVQRMFTNNKGNDDLGNAAGTEFTLQEREIEQAGNVVSV